MSKRDFVQDDPAGYNPIARINPTGRNWFYYQAKNEKDKTWHWQKCRTGC